MFEWGLKNDISNDTIRSDRNCFAFHAHLSNTSSSCIPMIAYSTPLNPTVTVSVYAPEVVEM
ncbi:hypothetical protein AGMMS49965_13200 [Bacteroidia bacterium]|nr:hypothetical protein AGMMS49965_13200 [Bacteroidia bacterium]